MPSPSVALLRTQTDERLVALAAGGHERAFEATVERYRRQLLRHARRYLPEGRAEDALQQALLSAWTGLRRGDDVRELRPWLHRIVHNTSLNALRASGYDYDELRETLEGSGGPAELAERRAVVRGTLAGLAGLPERQREALLQIAVEGRSQDEVAEELGLSQGAVRQLVHRARTALRSAATAVVPLPLATWLATAGAGGGATLAKAGAVAVLAGGAVAGPAVVVSEVGDEPRVRVEAGARQPDGGGAPQPTAPAPPADGDVAGPGGVELSGAGDDRSGRGGGEAGRDDSSGPGSPGRGRHGDDDSSGPGRGDDDGTRDSSGPGSGPQQWTGADESASGDDDSSGPGGSSGGSGSSSDD